MGASRRVRDVAEIPACLKLPIVAGLKLLVYQGLKLLVYEGLKATRVCRP